MVVLVYVGPAGVSHTDPPLGQLELSTRIFAEPAVAERLLQSGLFEVAQEPVADGESDVEPTEPATQPDTSAQED